MIHTHVPHPLDSSIECCVFLSIHEERGHAVLYANVRFPLNSPFLTPEFVQTVILEGAAQVALFSKSPKKIIEGEDSTIVETSEYILKAQSDADLMSRLELATGKNMRDQFTVEELQEIAETARLHRMGPSRN